MRIHLYLTHYFIFLLLEHVYMLIKHEIYEHFEMSDKTTFLLHHYSFPTRLWANALDIDITQMGSEASQVKQLVYDHKRCVMTYCTGS